MDNNEALRQRNNVLVVQRVALDNQVAVLEAETRGLVEQLAKAQANAKIFEARCARLAGENQHLREELIEERVQYAKLTEEIEGADDLPSPRSLPVLESIQRKAVSNG